MLLDGVYSRKRRDTFNEHALSHQTVTPPSHDPEELPLTPTIASTAVEIAGSGQRTSVRLHEDSGKAVHVPTVHVDGRGPVDGAVDRIEGAIAEEATAPGSPGSTTPSRPVSLLANVVSSTTNYSHDRSTHTTVAVDLTLSSSTSADSDSVLSSSVREARIEATGTSPPPSPSLLLPAEVLPPDDTSGHTGSELPTSVDEGPADVVVATPRRAEHVAKLGGGDDSADFDGAANAGTSESSGIAESSGGIAATTTSASGGEDPAKLRADSGDHEHEVAPIVDGTAANDNNVHAADYSSDVGLADGTAGSTTATESLYSDEPSENLRSNVSNPDWEANDDSSGELLAPAEMYLEEVNVSEVSPNESVDDDITPLSKNENDEKSEEEKPKFAEDRDDASGETISPNEDNQSTVSVKSNGGSKAVDTTTGPARSQTSSSSSSDVVKETRELSREYSSSESSETSSNVVKAADSTEELQQDYPVPAYSYGEDEVEIVNLRQKGQPIATAETERDPADKSAGPGIFDNDVGTNTVSRKERDKGDLRVVVRQGSDEEFIRKFEEKFHAASIEIDDSSENPPPIEADCNSAATDALRETMHDSLGHASASNTDNLSGSPMTQRVQIVEVPVYHDGTSEPSFPSSPSSSSSSTSLPHRVLINITIASENSPASSSRPLYVLSVSVPTEIDVNGARSSGININQAQVRAAERPSEEAEAASMLRKIVANSESIEPLDTMRLPPPPQPPASPPAPIWAGGECECSCPCMGSSSDEWDNFSAFDEGLNVEQEQLEQQRANSTLPAKEPRQPEATQDQKGQRGESSSTPGDSVRNVTDTSTEDYYPSSTVQSAENSEFTSEITPTYEPEVSTDMWACSGTTPLPLEPTILILEGEAPFT